MKYTISKKDQKVHGAVTLPGSKSISNRALIIKSLCHDDFSINRISSADDTVILDKCLNFEGHELNVGAGGTTMRFLTALLAVREGTWILTGPEEIKSRPIGLLVDVLRILGARIDFLEKENFLPLRIEGRRFNRNILTIDTNESSQYISALLLIAPTLPNGLKLYMTGKMVSMFYIRMTLKIMEHFGIEYGWEKNIIVIPSQPYKACDINIEADWTAGSYYYQMAALANEAELLLHGLYKESIQGDAMIAELMVQFGIKTDYEKDAVRLTKQAGVCSEFVFDFINNPDLAQTILVTCAALGITAKVRGIDNLRIKETDRISALQNEFMKLGVGFEEEEEDFHLSGKVAAASRPVSTYKDHRMAMAFAPLALLMKTIDIEDPKIVSKSYPGFWNDIRSLGFEIDGI